MIVKRLAEHIDGLNEMSATQIAAARILLDRTVPVLKPVEDQGDGGQDFKDITPQRLLHVIEGRLAGRRVEQDKGEPESTNHSS